MTAARDVRAAPGVDLCDARALTERGRAHVWDIDLRGDRATAFALRIDGRVVAYVNRCVHVEAEMDWNPGEFLDREGRTIICSLHGATYEPARGRCLGGPCAGGALEAIDVREEGARVRWYPSADIRPHAPPQESP
jgi:nitrite reductase/ring-hydroxylating ferredoxin subunit